MLLHYRVKLFGTTQWEITGVLYRVKPIPRQIGTCVFIRMDGGAVFWLEEIGQPDADSPSLSLL